MGLGPGETKSLGPPARENRLKIKSHSGTGFSSGPLVLGNLYRLSPTEGGTVTVRSDLKKKTFGCLENLQIPT